MENEYKNHTICDIHEKMIDLLEELIESVSSVTGTYNTVEELEYIISDMTYELKDITNLIKIAKEKGQSMEDRLYLYREAIEGLGFIRKSE